MSDYLASSVADADVDSVLYLDVLKLALSSSDSWFRDYARYGLLIKCAAISSPQEWIDFSNKLDSLFPNDERLAKIALAGRLFTDFSNPNREQQRRDCTLWLISNIPDCNSLLHPHLYDLDDQYFSEGVEAWNEALASNATNATIIRNATAYFFRRAPDRCLLLCQQGTLVEPDNPWWSERIEKLNMFHAQ